MVNIYWRRPKVGDALWLFFLFAFACLAGDACPTIYHGTLIAYWYETGSVTVAAESHMVIVGTKTGRQVQQDTACKISLYGDNFIFSFYGYFSEMPQPLVSTIWKANPSASAEQIARLWADSYRTILLAAIQNNPSIGRKFVKQVTGGLFVTQAGYVQSVAEAWLRWDLGKYQEAGQLNIWPEFKIPELEHLGFLGDGDIPMELMRDNTPRAIAFRNKVDTHRVPANVLLEKLILEAEKLDQTGDIGGEVDVIQLRAGERAAWLKKKANCPENQP